MKIETLTPQICGLLLGQSANLYWKNESGQLEFERAGILISIKPKTDGQHPLVFQCGNGPSQRELAYDYSEVVFRLRPLSSLTESEARELYEMVAGEKWKQIFEKQADECLPLWVFDDVEDLDIRGIDLVIGSPAAWLHLLSLGFDLFGLIAAGLAKEIETDEQYRTRRMKEEGITEQDIYDTDPHR